jgi:hypothetical protein
MTTGKSADDAVLDDVFSSDRDRGANAETPPTAEPAAPPVPREQPQTEVQTDLEDAIKAVDQSRMVPLAELIAERKKFRGQHSELERRAIEAEARAKAYEQFAPRQQQPPPRQVQAPDPFVDPQGYAHHVASEAAQLLETERLHNSEERARDKFGDAEVTEAFEAAKKAGLIERRHFIQANPRHPWGELMTWWKQQKVLQTVGDDPDAYEKKVEERVRQRLAEEAAKAGQPAAVAPTRFPGTLADATATGQQGTHLTPEAAMKSVFSSDRDRRK